MVSYFFVVIQSLTHVQLFATPWAAACQASLPSLSLRDYSNLCRLSQWCHPTVSSSAAPFSSCPQSFPASVSFQWVGSSYQVAKVLELQLQASVLPMSIQGWFPLGLTGLISLQSKGLSGAFSSTIVWRHQFFSVLTSLWFSSHNCMWPLGRPVVLTIHGPLTAK